MTGIEEIVNSIPQEMRTSIKLLSDDTRFAILLILLREGEKSFSELSEMLGVQRNVLSHHLKALCQAALVMNYYSKKEGTEDYSFYDTTNLSRDFADRLFGMMEPRKSSADLLAKLYSAYKEYAEGSVKLVSALQDYGNITSMDSIILVKGEKIELKLPQPAEQIAQRG